LARASEAAAEKTQKDHALDAAEFERLYSIKEAALAQRLRLLAKQRKSRSTALAAQLAREREEAEVAELARMTRAARAQELAALEARLAARALLKRERWAREWALAAEEKESARLQAERDALVKVAETLAYKRSQYELKRLQARAGVLWVRVIRASNLGEEPPFPLSSQKAAGKGSSLQSSPASGVVGSNSAARASPLLAVSSNSRLPAGTSSCLAVSLRFKAANLASETVYTRFFGRDGGSPVFEETFKLQVHNAALQTLSVAVMAHPIRQVELWERELRAALSCPAQAAAPTTGAPSASVASVTVSSADGSGATAFPLLQPMTARPSSASTAGVGSSSNMMRTQLEDLARMGLLCVRSALIQEPSSNMASSAGNSVTGSPVTLPLPVQLRHRRHVSLGIPMSSNGSVAASPLAPSIRVQQQGVAEEEEGEVENEGNEASDGSRQNSSSTITSDSSSSSSNTTTTSRASSRTASPLAPRGMLGSLGLSGPSTRPRPNSSTTVSASPSSSDSAATATASSAAPIVPMPAATAATVQQSPGGGQKHPRVRTYSRVFMPSPPAGAASFGGGGGWGAGLASGFLNHQNSIGGSSGSAAGNIIADSMNASAALAAGAQASNEVLVSSISTAALAQLRSQARLRERDDVLEVRKAEEQGCTSSIALLTVRSATEGRRIWRDLPVTMELTDAKRKQREAKRIAAKKALVAAASKPQQQQATHAAAEASAAASPIAGTAAPSPVLSSNSSLTKLPAITPRSGGGAQTARAVVAGKKQKKKRQAYSDTEESIPCGSVSIELLLLPLFGTVAATDATHGPCGGGSDTSSVGAISHNKKQKNTKNLRIGASELTPEEQQVVELELEREAEVAAAAMSMPPPSTEWVEQERRQHAAASTMEEVPSSSPLLYDLVNQEATVGGLRMQIAPAVRARAGQSVAQQAAALAAAAAVAAVEQLEQHAGDGRSSRDGQTPHRSTSRAAAAAASVAALQLHQPRQLKKQNQPGGADWLKMDMVIMPSENETAAATAAAGSNDAVAS
jgi:hypothetical protein